MEQVQFNKFKQRLKSQYGLDLELYKEAQIMRRLRGYMQRHQLSGFAELENYIGSSHQATHLIDYLDINVSEFFRNPELFTYLEQEILSRWLTKHPPVRIWSAGCSIGAEPYSLAIAILEAGFRGLPSIWATDLDAGALQQAKVGQYALQDVRNVTPSRLKKYFDLAGDIVTVKSVLKERLQFARHDLLSDPIKGSFELIVCRNVAIYFTEDAKTAMLKRFAAALANDGILFTGATESYLNYRELGLNRVSSCFYRKEGA
ncbi:MAG: Chemotaxis protein methyltransferase [Firmicutes bacterium]|nr:Chemotaxis protein methyltransferase [Bacillota bacterium]